MQQLSAEKTHRPSVWSTIKKDFLEIPKVIRIICLSMALFVLGRGLWADPFLSLYFKSIVNNVFRVAVISALVPLIKMFFSVTIGKVDDHENIRSVILLSKIGYVVMSIVYVLAGFLHSVPLLIIGCVINGIMWAAFFTSSQSLIRKLAPADEKSTVFGLMFSALNLAYVVGGLGAAVLIRYFPIHILFILIGVTAIISFFIDKRLPTLSKKKLRELLGKETFIHHFTRGAFSFSSIKRGFSVLQFYDGRMYQALWYELMYNILNYIGFIFIPIIAIQNDLSLSQIAIIFVIMRLPYLISFFSGEVADKYNKKRFILIALLFLSFLYALLGFRESFGSIIIVSLGIAVGLAAVRPVISWLVSDYTDHRNDGSITGIQECTANGGAFLGAIGFGTLAAIFGMSNSFVVIGIGIFVLAVRGLTKKFLLAKRQ